MMSILYKSILFGRRQHRYRCDLCVCSYANCYPYLIQQPKYCRQPVLFIVNQYPWLSLTTSVMIFLRGFNKKNAKRSKWFFTQCADSHVCFGLFPRCSMLPLVRAKKTGSRLGLWRVHCARSDSTHVSRWYSENVQNFVTDKRLARELSRIV